MKPIGNKMASLVPFEISESKRNGQQAIPYSKLRIDPLMRMLHPDVNYDWKALLQGAKPTELANHTALTVSPKSDPMIYPITPNMIPLIGLQVLPDRRICLGGQKLDGILMPQNPYLQHLLLMRFLAYYRTCIGITAGNALTANRECFEDRQATFLKIYLWVHRRPVFQMPGK